MEIESELESYPLLASNLKFHSHLGICLGGSKNDKTVLCNLRYFNKYNKLVVQDVFESLGTRDGTSADLQLLSVIYSIEKVQNIAFNVSLQLPPCIRCKLKCPGVEDCSVVEVKWMRDQFEKWQKKNKKIKMASPYTDRPAEYFVNNTMDKQFEMQYSLSANAAPLTARAYFLQQHLEVPCIELIPQLSLWRIGSFLKIPKLHLKDYRKDDHCEEIRFKILESFKSKFPLFLYHQDQERIVCNANAFDAFISAFTAFLATKSLIEDRPKGFPAKANWISIPKEDLSTLCIPTSLTL